MNLTDFLRPVSQSVVEQLAPSSPRSWYNHAQVYVNSFPDIDACRIWIVGVKDDRGITSQAGAAAAPDAIRLQLYRLINHHEHLSVADLGNIEAGESLSDTAFALNQVMKEALHKKKIIIVLGGASDLTYYQYRAYEGVSRTLRLVNVDSRIQLSAVEGAEEEAYLNRIILHEPNFLFNVTHLAYQTYFCEEESLHTFNRMNFDAFRLGFVTKNIEECEPLLRDADMCSFNMAAIRMGDAPGQVSGSPNGLFGDEACQIARYAGVSNELSSLGLFGYVPHVDVQQQSAKLLAQLIWYFVDGVYNRKNDYPAAESSDFQTYRITFNNSSHEVVFTKALKATAGGWRYHTRLKNRAAKDATWCHALTKITKQLAMMKCPTGG